jgi:hypothetical protein
VLKDYGRLRTTDPIELQRCHEQYQFAVDRLSGFGAIGMPGFAQQVSEVKESVMGDAQKPVALGDTQDNPVWIRTAT